MSDLKQEPEHGCDGTAVVDRPSEAVTTPLMATATPANVTSVLSETRFPFQK